MVVAFIKRGNKWLEFEREFGNKHDENAIKIIGCSKGFFTTKHFFIGYVPTNAIIEHIQNSGYSNVAVEILRSNVIAKLRDANVLIASSNKGYKFPTKVQDMRDFVYKINSQVVPQLMRLNRARNNILMATSNELDIIEGENFVDLQGFIDVMNTPKFGNK